MRATWLLVLAACGRIGFGPKADAVSDASADAPGDSPALAPPSFAQVGCTGPIGATQVSVALTADPAVDSLLVVAADISESTTGVASITDTQGNTYTSIGTFVGLSGYQTLLAYAYVTTSGPTTITMQLTAMTARVNLRVAEYQNVAPGSPLDGASSTNAGDTAGTDAASTTLTTTEPNTMLVGLCTFGGSGMEGTGYTTRTMCDGDIFEDRVAATAGTHAVTCTTNAVWMVNAIAIRGR